MGRIEILHIYIYIENLIKGYFRISFVSYRKISINFVDISFSFATEKIIHV